MLAAELQADRARALMLTPVSRETSQRLDRLVDVLLEWQRKINLIAASTVPKLWTRHIADSLQLLPLAPKARHWVDLGSGAGFPGLVIAAALADERGAEVHLIESNAKKAAFLRAAARHIRAPAVIHGVRIEDFVQKFDQRVDAVTARALAPLDTLLRLAHPLLERGAPGLFLKGQDAEAELTHSAKAWTIEGELVASKTNPLGRIVIVRNLVPARG
jgi:16S rRNA (guanine527-N7)-methyltransferase